MEEITALNHEKGSREWSFFGGVRGDKVSIFGTPRFPATERRLLVREEIKFPLILQHP
jgi:hypothetical protein